MSSESRLELIPQGRRDERVVGESLAEPPLFENRKHLRRRVGERPELLPTQPKEEVLRAYEERETELRRG